MKADNDSDKSDMHADEYVTNVSVLAREDILFIGFNKALKRSSYRA